MHEWQTDERGQRFRMIGGVKEYETIICVDGAQVPQSQLEEFHRQRKEAAERQRKAEQASAAEAPPARICPLREGIDDRCEGSKCALYLNGCVLSQISDRAPAKDTKGLTCPLNRYRTKCREDCALYENGCKITAMDNRKGL